MRRNPAAIPPKGLDERPPSATGESTAASTRPERRSMSTTTTTPDRGQLLYLPAKDLSVITAIQRQPSPARVRQFQGERWNEAKTGILSVARIIEGEYAGRLHVVDGGTRWKAKIEEDENYIFPCYVREMTLEGAAQAFLAFNKDSMKPSAFARFAVGVRAGEPAALAVKAALESIPLNPNPSVSNFGDETASSPGEFAAFAAAERIVQKSYATNGDWDTASELLAWSIRMGRRAYPQHGVPGAAFGHDADIIQAIARIGMENPLVLGDDQRERNLARGINTWTGTGERLTKLFKTGSAMEPSHWKIELMNETKSHGGSASRGHVLARLIVRNHNRDMTPRLNQV
jgi:hypothetical protein